MPLPPYPYDLRALSYLERNVVLQELGFESYDQYLASPLWAGLRQEVLKREKWTCKLCGGKAVQVHHVRYCRANLEGRHTCFMHAVCVGCHEAVEFADGVPNALGSKLTAQESEKKFQALLNSGKMRFARAAREVTEGWKRYTRKKNWRLVK